MNPTLNPHPRPVQPNPEIYDEIDPLAQTASTNDLFFDDDFDDDVDTLITFDTLITTNPSRPSSLPTVCAICKRTITAIPTQITKLNRNNDPQTRITFTEHRPSYIINECSCAFHEHCLFSWLLDAQFPTEAFVAQCAECAKVKAYVQGMYWGEEELDVALENVKDKQGGVERKEKMLMNWKMKMEMIKSHKVWVVVGSGCRCRTCLKSLKVYG
jgi:hypothetical protein